MIISAKVGALNLDVFTNNIFGVVTILFSMVSSPILAGPSLLLMLNCIVTEYTLLFKEGLVRLTVIVNFGPLQYDASQVSQPNDQQVIKLQFNQSKN